MQKPTERELLLDGFIIMAELLDHDAENKQRARELAALWVNRVKEHLYPPES